MCGTIDYLAPEVLNRSYDGSVDLWCLGVLVFEFLTGRPPFEERTEAETVRRIERMEIKWPRNFSEVARDLISRLLVSSERRIGLDEILSHPFTVRN
jgi:aurora kinase